MSLVKDITVIAAQAVVTAVAGILTNELTTKVEYKAISKRYNKLTDEEKKDDELVNKIIKGEVTKRNITNALLWTVESVGIGIGTGYVSDALLGDTSDSSTEDTAAAYK